MDIKAFVDNWIAASNSFNVTQYLELYHEDAVLDDPSVGRKFVGHKGIKEYYTSYFIGYNTQTRLLKIATKAHSAHIEVEFTGDFPEGKIGGLFDLTFREGKIADAKADLIST